MLTPILVLVFGLAGLLVGEEVGRDFDWVGGAGLGVLVALHLRLRSRVRGIERKLAGATAPAAAPAVATARREVPDLGHAAPAPDAGLPAEPAPEPPARETPAPSSEPWRAGPPAPSLAAGPAGVDPEPAPGAGTRGADDPWSRIEDSAWSSGFAEQVRRIVDFARGGNPLVRVGVVVLFFGVAFLLKYTADLGLLPIEYRLAAVAAGGIGLLGLGWWLRARPGYGIALQGGGIGVLYLTVFAAFRLYGLLPAGAAFTSLVALVALAGVIALAQNSATIAVLGTAGGFLAPVLASTGAGSHVVLFSYYLLLDLGILGIAWFRAWRGLNLLGFGFTFGIGAAWGYDTYRPELFASTEPFLIGFGLLYVVVSVLFALRQPPRLRGFVDGTLVFGTPLVVFTLQSQVIDHVEHGLAYSAVGFAVFYVLLAWWLLRRHGTSLRVLAEAFLATGVVFATLSVPLALDADWTTVTWALEGAGVIWVGVRQQRLVPRIAGVALQVLAGATLVVAPMDPQAPAFWNVTYLSVVVVALSAWFSGAYLSRHAGTVRPWERWVAVGLGVWGIGWWLAGGVRESGAHAVWAHRWGVLLVYVALSAIALERAGAKLGYAVLRYPSLGLAPFGAVMLVGMAIDEPHPFAHGGDYGWPVALASIYLALRRIERIEPETVVGRAGPWLVGALHAVALWLLAAVGALELAYGLDQWTGHAGPWSRLGLGLVPAVLVMIAALRPRWLAWPVGAHDAAYTLPGSGPLVAWLAGWLLVANVLDPALPWDIGYLPVLNPLDLSSMAAIVAMATWWVRGRAHLERRWPDPRWGRNVAIALGVLVFFWVNTVLLRTVHAWSDVPYEAHDLFESVVVQTTLSVFWAAAGLVGMVLAARRGLRVLWMIAAGLMAAVVVKLFVVDLASTGTLARIVSFLSVGGLLLTVGYFAPAPPRRREADAGTSAPEVAG